MLAKKPRGATEKRKSSSVSGLLWMFVGAILTLMIGVFIYLSPLFDFSPTGSETAADADRQIQPRVETDTDNADYEFYDILPNQEMATIPDEDIGGAENDRLGATDDFEADVVVTQPETNADNSNDTGNFGISETTTIEPSSNSAANNSGANSSASNEITIVEENATYDGTTPASPNSNASNNANTAANSGAATVQRAQAPTYILQINSFKINLNFKTKLQNPIFLFREADRIT